VISGSIEAPQDGKLTNAGTIYLARVSGYGPVNNTNYFGYLYNKAVIGEAVVNAYGWLQNDTSGTIGVVAVGKSDSRTAGSYNNAATSAEGGKVINVSSGNGTAPGIGAAIIREFGFLQNNGSGTIGSVTVKFNGTFGNNNNAKVDNLYLEGGRVNNTENAVINEARYVLLNVALKNLRLPLGFGTLRQEPH
jgi:hypothetical protein